MTNPATYVGFYDTIRDLSERARRDERDYSRPIQLHVNRRGR